MSNAVASKSKGATIKNTTKKSSAKKTTVKNSSTKKAGRTTPKTKNTAKKTARKSVTKSGAKKPIIKRIFYYGATAGVWAFMLGLIVLAVLSLDLPDLDDPPQPGAGDTAVIVKAANGATLVRSGPSYGDWISYEETPDALINAFLAVEDRYFFDHPGIDIRGLARALFTNITAGRVRAGGSTLTQQLAKNLFLTNQRTLKRKAQELLLAFWLEQKFTKRQILTLYLNRMYFGGGAYGIDAASRKYFGHSARDLSIAEAATIAGLVKAPSRYAPHINPSGAWKRAQLVLGTMADTGAITPAAAAKIKTQPPVIKQAAAGRNVRYYTDWIEGRARRLLPDSRGESLIIYSTLDPSVQRAAAMALERGLSGEGKKKGAGEGAIVAIDHDGAVRAMVGGSDYAKTQFNRAVQALRQPGSAFKLFAYLAALESGITPTDRYVDKKITIDGWSPKNYNGKFNGEMSAREAFARSINTIAVQISEKVGRGRVAAMAKRLGITTNVSPLASLPLGTEEVRLIDLASAYAAVANGGHLAPSYAIVEITSLEGEVLYRRRPNPPIAVLAYPTVKSMTEMLTSVVKWGSGKNAAIDGPAAGKSGTTQNNRDAVFVGFTSDMTAAVWVGNDDNKPMSYVTGGGLPARIWSDFMLEAHVGQPVRPLLADAGIYSAAADFRQSSTDGLRKKKKEGFFERIFN
ncbi:MAG: PBP1A family penicillin-binding protein [Kordiimonadaceae bacterium]|nr:PBP1A family penicillin-binding protein [Kordiimonadaceae bacterium]